MGEIVSCVSPRNIRYDPLVYTVTIHHNKRDEESDRTSVSSSHHLVHQSSTTDKTELETSRRNTEGYDGYIFKSNNKLRLKSAISRSFKSSPSDTNSSPWKFWRRLSTRNRQDSKRLSPKDRPEIVSLDKPNESKTPDGPLTPPSSPMPSSGPLPDVVEKAYGVPKFNGSSVPPPKPPRLFLFRTPSNITRHSMDNENDTDALYVNSERVAEMRAQRRDLTIDTFRPDSFMSFSDSVKGVKFLENNNLVHQSSRPNMELDTSTVSHISNEITFHQNSSLASSANFSVKGILHSDHLNSVARISKIKTPELNRKQPGRSSRRSSDKVEVTRQKHIMNSISELIRQWLDPYPVLDQLKRSGFLTNIDVQALLSCRDRKSVCEGIVGLVGDATPDALSLFCDALFSTGNSREILEVLQIMREMDRIIHDVSCNTCIEDLPSKDKNFSFDVGYLAPDYSLRPLVELERVRASSDKRLSKASSRNSAHSLLEVSNSDSSNFPGLIMMSICVTGHNLSGQRTEALANVIKWHNCISELHIGRTQLCGEDIAVITRALEENGTIHLLDLRLNNIDYTGAIAVTELIQKTKSLQHLNLSYSNLDLSILKTLMVAIASNKSLIDIDVSFLDINDEHCNCLQDMLKVNTCLQKLRLRGNMLTWSGCYMLAEGLVRNRNLNVLDLSRNTIGDDGVQALAKFLPESSITEVCLENCGVTSAGCDALVELVTHCKKLKHLNISANVLLDIGISKLATALERTSSLENLGLNICGITNEGFSKLLDVLEKNTSIVQVKLCYNKLGGEQSDPSTSSENLRYRLRIVTSSKPKLQILLWGNSFDES